MPEKLMYIPCNMCEYVNMMLLLLAPAQPSIVSGFMRCVKICTTKSKIKRQVLGILSAQNSKRDLVTYSFFRTNQSLQDLYRKHNRKMQNAYAINRAMPIPSQPLQMVLNHVKILCMQSKQYCILKVYVPCEIKDEYKFEAHIRMTYKQQKYI